MNFYAVAKGFNVGIFNDWNDCKKSITDYKNPKFRKFTTLEEAEKFVNDNKEKNIDVDSDYKKYDIVVFTDGCCKNNGNSGIGSIGIFFNDDDERNVSLKLKGEVTNNIAELTAILQTLIILKDEIKEKMKILIVSDSEYAIKCATHYGKKLEENGWLNSKGKTPPNLELVQQIYAITSKFKNIKFKHVMAHTENKDFYSIGNAHADRLANLALGISVSEKKDIKIYLNVPFANKDEAKKLGARWDVNMKKWYSFDNNPNIETLKKNYK